MRQMASSFPADLKPHNAFRGPYESGPCKMMTVGLGKQKGASLVHTDGMDVISQKHSDHGEGGSGEGKDSFLQFPVSRMPMMKPARSKQSWQKTS